VSAELNLTDMTILPLLIMVEPFFASKQKFISMIDGSLTMSHLFHNALVSFRLVLDGKLNFLMTPALDPSIITISNWANSTEVAKNKKNRNSSVCYYSHNRPFSSGSRKWHNFTTHRQTIQGHEGS